MEDEFYLTKMLAAWSQSLGGVQPRLSMPKNTSIDGHELELIEDYKTTWLSLMKTTPPLSDAVVFIRLQKQQTCKPTSIYKALSVRTYIS